MSAAITAVGIGLAGNAILQNQANKAAEGAANAQKKSISAATQVERERLAQEQAMYQEQMTEYRRKQAMQEKQTQQTIVNLAPYMQAGQGALYEMMALTGMAPPQGAQMPQGPQPVAAGLRAGGMPAPATTTEPGRMGILSGGARGLRGTITGASTPPAAPGPLSSAAAAEFGKGGLSLSSKRWKMADPNASPRAQAANMLSQVRGELPNATTQEQQDEAIRRLNQQEATQTQQAMIDEARAQVPTVETAINPYAGMTGAQSQETAVSRIAESPLLQELMAQGETGILQSAARTGGLRGGNVQGALAQFRPQMLQAELDKQYARLQGLSGLGQQSILQAPTTATGAAPTMSYQSDIPGLLTQAGAAEAGGILSQAQGMQDFMRNTGQLVGWGLEKYGQGGFSPWKPGTTTAPNYANLGIGNPSNY
ncbi:MAG: hypothetical protein KJP07_23265 [Desulfatitalea sp.]|nr:hypothetical protein [Desulfatitalea sp.]